MDDNTKLRPLTNDEIYAVLTNYTDTSNCQGSMQWTAWNSASDAINGSDFEILADHIKSFG